MNEAEPKDRAASRPAKKEVRLTPPPRVSDARDRESWASSRTSGGHRLPFRGFTVGAFVLLAVAAVVVFVFLPRWVEKQQVATHSAPPVESLGVEPAETPSFSAEKPIPAPEIEDFAPSEPPPSDPTPEPASQDSVSKPPARSASPSPPAPPARVDPADAEFRRSMSAGLAALERQDFATAHDHLRRAVELDPDSPESADALLAAQEGLRLQAIASHRAKASELEAAERWREALGEYEAVLALDSTIKFAQEGAERSRIRAELSDRLEFHLQNPERLVTETVLHDAEDALEEASQIQPADARLSQQIAELRRIVEIASTPIRVALRSDNLTEVTIYKVGRLGTFEQRVLELRPGTYIVVGRRDGYRDVRRRLEVVPGREIEPLIVRCEEKI